MKRLCIGMIIFFVWISELFASSLQLELDKKEVELGDYIRLHLEIQAEENMQNENISIQGIESFSVVSQSQSSSVQIINSDVTQTQKIDLVLQANTLGRFTLGPASITTASGIVESESFEIEVLDSNSSSPARERLGGRQVQEEEKKDAEVKEDEQQMQDIHDIKTPKISWGNNYVLYPLIIALFFLIYFAITRKYLEGGFKEKTISIPTQKTGKEVISEGLGKLLKQYSDLEREVFYSQLNGLYRKYFALHGIHRAEVMTYAELKKLYDLKNISNILLDNYRDAYFMEFSLKEDSLEFRRELLNDFINELQ